MGDNLMLRTTFTAFDAFSDSIAVCVGMHRNRAGRNVARVIVTDIACGLEHLAGGANIDVALRVKREVAA